MKEGLVDAVPQGLFSAGAETVCWLREASICFPQHPKNITSLKILLYFFILKY